jgi:hypothetical protein
MYEDAVRVFLVGTKNYTENRENLNKKDQEKNHAAVLHCPVSIYTIRVSTPWFH